MKSDSHSSGHLLIILPLGKSDTQKDSRSNLETSSNLSSILKRPLVQRNVPVA